MLYLTRKLPNTKERLRFETLRISRVSYSSAAAAIVFWGVDRELWVLGDWLYTKLNIIVDSRVDDLMETKGGKKKSSSKSLFYEAPLGYSIEDIRPNGGIKKFRSAAYSNCARKPS
ncbi:hypothetical protein Salat_1315000 [Sesamum alatum]|uniref:Uncharacterized protein n=1 Tax=Sesamum alatum TaxID=300844 RepID=A0AAE2CPW2_9LAMI|nr:hypothetical protein Salat_1315000 [Sesamum alatum]